MNFFQKIMLFLTSNPSIHDDGTGVISSGEAIDSAAEVVNNAAPGGGIEIFTSIFMWLGILAMLYFFFIRPQRKRDKQVAQMQSALKVGDRVLTSNGFYGKIVDVGNDAFIIEFGENRGIRIPVRKTDIIGLKEPDMTPPSKEEKIEDKKTDK